MQSRPVSSRGEMRVRRDRRGRRKRSGEREKSLETDCGFGNGWFALWVCNSGLPASAGDWQPPTSIWTWHDPAAPAENSHESRGQRKERVGMQLREYQRRQEPFAVPGHCAQKGIARIDTAVLPSFFAFSNSLAATTCSLFAPRSGCTVPTQSRSYPSKKRAEA